MVDRPGEESVLKGRILYIDSEKSIWTLHHEAPPGEMVIRLITRLTRSNKPIDVPFKFELRQCTIHEIAVKNGTPTCLLLQASRRSRLLPQVPEIGWLG